jgi:hypothetical protein
MDYKKVIRDYKYRRSEKELKRVTLKNWIRRGLCFSENCYFENYDELYKAYKDCDVCNYCLTAFKNKSDRTMDHDHHTGLFRWFLCQQCNREGPFRGKNQFKEFTL